MNPRSPDPTSPDFYLWGEAKSAAYRDRKRTLNNELKTVITAYIRNTSQSDLQKVRIKLNEFRPVSTLVDITSNIFCKFTATF
jgi:hypothetical protein